jgi:pseudouridine synthase
MKERLQKFLSAAGVASRRAAEQLIRDGKVIVNQEVAELGMKIDPSFDEIEVNGEIISGKPKHIYILMNKPKGYLTSCSDQDGQSIMELLPETVEEKVFPVGRLDKDSEGLVLLTNDGELANRLTHPRYQSEKEYLVEISQPIPDEDLDRLRKGIKLEEYTTKPCTINRIEPRKFKIILKEGRKRQIRLMFRAVGRSVIKLKRIRIKNLILGSLESGQIRGLSSREIKELKLF